jgi:hypothetical protein
MPAAFHWDGSASRYLLAGALSIGGLAGGLPERFMSGPVGDAEGGWAGCAGAAPVVIPGSVLVRGVTSRMPGGAAGGDVCAVFWAVGDVPAWLIDELFRP